ncbi:hypothetical protein C9Z41_16550 [Escherichia coli]|nr:hypothetical protein C9Z41_16550 [Escherichia coli]
MVWQPEFTDKTLSRKTGAVHTSFFELLHSTIDSYDADFDESAFFCLLFISVYPLRVHPMTGGKYDDTYLFANSCP